MRSRSVGAIGALFLSAPLLMPQPLWGQNEPEPLLNPYVAPPSLAQRAQEDLEAFDLKIQKSQKDIKTLENHLALQRLAVEEEKSNLKTALKNMEEVQRQCGKACEKLMGWLDDPFGEWEDPLSELLNSRNTVVEARSLYARTLQTLEDNQIQLKALQQQLAQEFQILGQLREQRSMAKRDWDKLIDEEKEKLRKASLKVSIVDLRNTKGQVVVALFNTDRAPRFPRDLKGALAIKHETINDELRASVVFTDLDKDSYAVFAFHDENNDGSYSSMLGVPWDGNGFSGERPGILSLQSFPTFAQAAIPLGPKEDRFIQIPIQYPVFRF